MSSENSAPQDEAQQSESSPAQSSPVEASPENPTPVAAVTPVEEPVVEEIEDAFEALDDLDETFTETEAVEAESVPEPVLAPVEDTPMMTSASISGTSTADAVAGSLGKLLSKVEFGEEAGGNNTIEGVVREMLRPMLKEWLDANLPGIVEKQVEVEVSRIARMAR